MREWGVSSVLENRLAFAFLLRLKDLFFHIAMCNVAEVFTLFLLSAIPGFTLECGRVDVVTPSSKPRIILHFLISTRSGNTPTIGGISVNSSLPIAFLDPDGVVRDPLGFIGQISSDQPEIGYIQQYHAFFEALRATKGDSTSEIVFEVACHFVPCLEKCRIVHKINDHVTSAAHIFWNGTNPRIRINDPEMVLSGPYMIRGNRSFALGACTDELKWGAEDIYERWSAVFTRIVNAATSYSSNLLFEFSPDPPRDVFCHLRTAAPLPFLLVIEGPGVKPIISQEAMSRKECVVATVANVRPPDNYNISQLTCTVMSPLGWNVSVRGPTRAYPESLNGGIVKEFQPGLRYYYPPRSVNWKTFMGIMAVGMLATFTFLALARTVAYFLVSSPCVIESGGATRQSFGIELCDRCKKKFN